MKAPSLILPRRGLILPERLAGRNKQRGFLLDPYRFIIPPNPVYGFQGATSYTNSLSNRRTTLATAVTAGFYQNLAGTALSGKKYWEMVIVSSSIASWGPGLGVTTDGSVSWNNAPSCFTMFGASFCGASAGLKKDGSNLGGYTFVAGDRMGFAYDSATRNFWIRKNGTWTGDPVAGTGQAATLTAGTYYPAASIYTCGGGSGVVVVDLCVSTSSSTNPLVGSVPSGYSAYEP